MVWHSFTFISHEKTFGFVQTMVETTVTSIEGQMFCGGF